MSGLEWDEASRGSFGGTEVMARELERRLPGELLERFQIVTSQVKTLAPGKIRIFWCHCTPCIRLPGVGRGNQLPVPHGSNVSRAGLRPSEQRRAV